MYYYNFHIGDFIKDSAHLTLEEEAIYRRLIDLYYTTEQPIPLDINAVSRSIRARGNEEMIELILNEFFNKTLKGFKQKRIEKELKKYKEKSEKAAKSAKARWDKASKPCERNANALQTHSEGNANRKPTTDNRKPTTNKDLFNECLKYFNDKTGKKFKTAKGLSTRLNDYSVDEVKSVIDSKTIEWLGDDQMEKYLRPETIFGSKFEGYLNNILSGIDGKPKPKDGGASGPDWKKGLSPEQINQMQGGE